MTSRTLEVLCGAALFAVLNFGATSVNAQQTVTITGCASLTSSTTPSGIVISCNQVAAQPGAPTCTSLGVSPPNDSTRPSSITLTAFCTQGTNPITSYTFSGPGLSGATQSTNSLVVSPAPSATAAYSVTASDGTLTSNSASGLYTVGGTAGSVDLSACTSQGFTGRLMDLTIVPGTNARLNSTANVAPKGSFGNFDAIVLRFTVPAADPSFSIKFSQMASTQQVFRVATLSTQPCQIATASGASGSILGSSYSQTPGFSLVTGQSTLAKIGLQAGATYYITLVNRNGYGGAGSCIPNSGACDVYMDQI